MPPDAVYVGRPGKYGNPFRHAAGGTPLSRAESVDHFRRAIVFWRQADWWPAYIAALCGKSLVCWCPLCDRHADGRPLDVECPDCPPCHADVLAELVS